MLRTAHAARGGVALRRGPALRCSSGQARAQPPSGAAPTDESDWRSPLLPGPSRTPLAPLPPGTRVTRPTDGGGALAAASTPSSSTSLAPPVVALGKFDALHRGHAALAAGAASLGGSPWLISFSGMADVLGWAPRAPLVAPCDRGRVLGGWASPSTPPPRERAIPFSAVRSLSPAAFVAILAHDLQAAGVVVGEGYRFGHKAAGDTAALEALGAAAGLTVAVLPLVVQGTAGGGGGPHDDSTTTTVSSSAVREALAAGEVGVVAGLLGRRHRLVGAVSGSVLAKAAAGEPSGALCLPAACLANEAPGSGVYKGVSVSVGGVCVAGAATVEVLPGGKGVVVASGAVDWPPDAASAMGATVLVGLDF